MFRGLVFNKGGPRGSSGAYDMSNKQEIFHCSEIFIIKDVSVITSRIQTPVQLGNEWLSNHEITYFLWPIVWPREF